MNGDGKRTVSHETIFADQYIQSILESTGSPKSTLELSVELKIPLSTAYRRLKNLRKYHLLKVSGVIRKGKRQYLYKNIM